MHGCRWQVRNCDNAVPQNSVRIDVTRQLFPRYETCLYKVDYRGGKCPSVHRPTLCCFEAIGEKLLSDLKWQRSLAHSKEEGSKCAESIDLTQEAFCGPHSTLQKPTLQTQGFPSLLAQAGSSLLILNGHYIAHHFPTLMRPLCRTHMTLWSCRHAS